MPKTFYMLPKWQNFAQYGHTAAYIWFILIGKSERVCEIMRRSLPISTLNRPSHVSAIPWTFMSIKLHFTAFA